MKLATFQADDGPKLGAILDGDRSIVDLAGAFRRRFGRAEAPLASMLAFIDGGPRARELADPLVTSPPDEDVADLKDVKLLAPLPEPRQIRDFLCFEEHLRNAFDEADRLAGTKTEIPKVWYEQPIYYKANRFSVVGHDAEVRWPSYCELLDYELELACVIGTGGVDIPRERGPGPRLRLHDLQRRLGARRPVQGDGRPARTGQGQGLRHRQRARAMDRDRRRDRRPLQADDGRPGQRRGVEPGDERCHAPPFEDVIAFVSRSETLHAGEVLGSGTVGTGCGLELGRFLSPGDVVELEIEGIGILRNTIVREKKP